ncbi:hypothetical protein EPA93_15640 [Ktedonosporobacter rubrisoli]|uniref:Uncharacterized protein n=1 Tax=Ktedonosporobacter rubrisoli TaxID=2509675 RepID=A0A4P6JPN6_KTERU|nr:hypothetical protein [Ktedonosporobacter rubrisoli]QBD77347.1 hypothetical protein EPA93_15640 [Ktedonosporobacter rubrisoli]
MRSAWTVTRFAIPLVYYLNGFDTTGLRASTTARKQETIERLRAANASLNEKKQDITAQSVYAECGLHYSSYVHNEDAIALFRASSTNEPNASEKPVMIHLHCHPLVIGCSTTNNLS